MAKIKNDYFKLVEEQAGYCVKASKLIVDMVENYSPFNLAFKCERMHEIEHAADQLHRSIILKLTAEFITPIDQEDILRLSQIIEDISDSLDEAVQEFYMYHVNVAPKGVEELAKIIDKCVNALYEAVSRLRDFKKPEKLRDILDSLTQIEEEADAKYAEVVYKLFQDETDAKILIGHKAIYDSLEDCCDLCDHAANMIEQIIMKNT